MDKGRERLFDELIPFAKELGLASFQELDPAVLVPEEWIRDLCGEDKCGNYGKNYMCPPFIGSIGEIKERLARYKRGVLFQYSKQVDVRGDRKGVEESKIDFHRKVLQMEDFLNSRGIKDVLGMVGGSCALCGECYAKVGKPCPLPEKARTSLESLGIAIIALLEELEIDAEFHPDKITWTGSILFNPI